MKKLLALVCVLSLFLGIFAGCKSREDDAVKVLYQQFIAGEITAFDKDGAEKTFLDYLEWDLEKQDYRYTFLDMTGDGIVELCIQQTPYKYFFTVKDNEIYHWHTEEGLYVNLLNNGALMYERHGGAPTHINYEYYELDQNAEVKFNVTFSCWDGQSIEEGKVYPDEYFFNEEKVTKDEYRAKTKKYLEIGSDKLVWYDMDGNKQKLTPIKTEELSNEELAKIVAKSLGVPDRDNITYSVGEKYYWDAGATYYKNVEFNENDRLVAFANVDPYDGTLLRNIAKYPIETLSEKLTREIDGAYDEEMKSPEDSSTAGMCAISEKYTKKWQAVADEYYNKLMQCDIKKTNETSYYTTQEFHTFIKNMKTSWEKDHAIQCENYKKTLYAIYGGTIVNTLYADYVYNEQMEWALKLVGIYEQL